MADAQGFKVIAKRASIDAIAVTAATLVLSLEGEVGDLKAPNKPAGRPEEPHGQRAPVL